MLMESDIKTYWS